MAPGWRDVGVFLSYAPGIIGVARPGSWRSILMTTLTSMKAPRKLIAGVEGGAGRSGLKSDALPIYEDRRIRDVLL